VSYLFVDARVVKRAAAAAPRGKRLAQVPRTASPPSCASRGVLFDASVTVRYIGQRYEDDLNTLSLGSYFVMDAMISRAITKNVEL